MDDQGTQDLDLVNRHKKARELSLRPGSPRQST
ncbi:hypothetical protein FRAAL0891 [Frankia alni ACN14a]|uniref:Uncharacterized protein n=1 Tax=Frankia alni (strain DSM 45986 / CECT 9034 / ACN14a) TaxID=326424 RepID=Q0RSA7_FRAAA|nr:hypothetical protein FRAAL0891 [Frankia alni ACN14a]